MKKPVIALQIYSLRDIFMKDAEKAIKEAAKMGYEGIEFFHYGEIAPAENLKKWLDEAGVFCVAHNVNWPDILPENIDKTLEYCKKLGTNRIIIGSAPTDQLDKRSKMQGLLDIILKAYEKAKAEGFEIGYHTHYTDFAVVDGINFWDRVLSNTPEDFQMILDTGNCEAGGGNSMHYLKKYPGRSMIVHLKPYHEKLAAATMMGEDSYDWDELVKLAVESGKADTLTVEYSYDNGKPSTENAKQCFDFIKAIVDKLF